MALESILYFVSFSTIFSFSKIFVNGLFPQRGSFLTQVILKPNLTSKRFPRNDVIKTGLHSGEEAVNIITVKEIYEGKRMSLCTTRRANARGLQ